MGEYRLRFVPGPLSADRYGESRVWRCPECGLVTVCDRPTAGPGCAGGGPVPRHEEAQMVDEGPDEAATFWRLVREWGPVAGWTDRLDVVAEYMEDDTPRRCWRVAQSSASDPPAPARHEMWDRIDEAAEALREGAALGSAARRSTEMVDDGTPDPGRERLDEWLSTRRGAAAGDSRVHEALRQEFTLAERQRAERREAQAMKVVDEMAPPPAWGEPLLHYLRDLAERERPALKDALDRPVFGDRPSPINPPPPPDWAFTDVDDPGPIDVETRRRQWNEVARQGYTDEAIRDVLAAQPDLTRRQESPMLTEPTAYRVSDPHPDRVAVTIDVYESEGRWRLSPNQGRPLDPEAASAFGNANIEGGFRSSDDALDAARAALPVLADFARSARDHANERARLGARLAEVLGVDRGPS